MQSIHITTSQSNHLIQIPPPLEEVSEPLIILGTRGSALARAQTTLVSKLLRAAHPDLSIEEKIITTIGDITSERSNCFIQRPPPQEVGSERLTGDARPMMPLHEPTAEGSGLFTQQLEEALFSHEIDAAVHSLKDLPVRTPMRLILAAILPRAATNDLLITLDQGGLEGLASGATIGSSSPRRVELLRHRRCDLRFTTLRGNVPTRLRKLAMNQRDHPLDAIVLAQAGLERLGYDLNIIKGEGCFMFDGTMLHVTELTWMLPAPGQGAIAIETRDVSDEKSSHDVSAYFSALHDEKTAKCVQAERLLLQYLGGGCHMALGALATLDESSQQIALKGVYVPYAGATPREGEARGATPEEVALLVMTQLTDKLA
ncbi:MAG: hydroxymethylbilane synthase [Verrucomicrobia bacterium RIFCSPHIGHO2_12_FULL_41_10]|nr:MAG: hydroxymethylbilane synthase [Verrucomicrobia bacterium RIFCSPHIGHO2_12_FULL_41_10]HLB34731.1 hydroxymethylbilane synthase [Chthoniobacterales bacterium]